MLRQIARASMDQLAAFLTSSEVAPGSAPAATEPQVAMADPAESSPEATGSVDGATPVPLPRRRPTAAAALSERSTLTLAASSR